MSDLVAVAVGSVLGILGTLAAVWLTHKLERQAKRDDGNLQRDLADLDAVEAAFKRLSSELTDELLVPHPFAGRRAVAAIRDLMYAGPVMLPESVVTRFLDVTEKIGEQRSLPALARRWILADYSAAMALAAELADAEAAVSAAIAARRRELVKHERPPARTVVLRPADATA